MFLVGILVLLLSAESGLAQVCQGNGFTGACADVFAQTGVPVGLAEQIGLETTELCESNRLAVLHDCTNRIPLYVGIAFDRAQIDASNPGRCSGCDFGPSDFIDGAFQAVDDDYSNANNRKPCFEKQSDNNLYRDQFWLDDAGVDQQCFSSEPATGTSRGHMIADSFVRLPESDKAATYHFTNCIPQYQKFNNEAWNIAEQALYPWAQSVCGSDISDPTERANAKMYLMVGAVPSTTVTATFSETNVEARWFGEWGFGDSEFEATIDYNGNAVPPGSSYRVNMPAAMWTSACCVATDANNNVAYVKHTAYARHAKPIGNDNPVVKASINDLLAQMLPDKDTSGINLFPNEARCNDPVNYVPT